MPKGIEIAAEVAQAAFRPRDKTPVADWGRQNLRLRESPYGNQFRPEETPWLVEPLTCVPDSQVETIVRKCAVKTGKTVSMQVASAWAMANQPGPTMIVMQDEDAAKDLAKERVIPTIESCEVLRKQFPTDRHRKTNLEIFFPSFTLKIGPANNSFLRSWSIRWAFADEVSAWKEGMVKRFRARTTRYWNRKHWFSSTPEDDLTDFEAEYNAGTCEEWELNCQGCGQHFAPDFYETIKWDTTEETKPGGEWNFEAVGPTVRMVCPHCQHTHENTESNWRSMTQAGRYAATNDNPAPGVRSFHFSQLTLPPSVMPWASLVVDFLKAKREASRGWVTPLREFVTLRLAQTWKQSEHMEVQNLMAADYSPKDAWPDEKQRFLTVDCQQYLEEFWAVVRAWGEDGASRLLAFRRLASFDDVRALQLEFGVADSKTFLDVGYERHRVLRACAQNGWIGLRGEDAANDYAHTVNVGGRNVQIKRVYSPPSRFSVGKGLKAPPVIRWSNPSVKDMMHILKSGRGAPWDVCDLEDMADEYARQIDSERKREVQDASGRVKLRWQQYRANHGWDCECMQLVAAIITRVYGAEEVPAAPSE